MCRSSHILFHLKIWRDAKIVGENGPSRIGRNANIIDRTYTFFENRGENCCVECYHKSAALEVASDKLFVPIGKTGVLYLCKPQKQSRGRAKVEGDYWTR